MSEKAKPLTAEEEAVWRDWYVSKEGYLFSKRLAATLDAARERIAELEGKLHKALRWGVECAGQRTDAHDRERKLVEALEAHHAWSYAEHHSLGCFEARGVLCAHAESLTARALAAIRGDAVPDYKGRRSLTVWPAVEITESDEASARALVAEVLEHERAALSPYAPAAPEMPADCHPQGE